MTFEEWKWEMSSQLDEMSMDRQLEAAWNEQQKRIDKLKQERNDLLLIAMDLATWRDGTDFHDEASNKLWQLRSSIKENEK